MPLSPKSRRSFLKSVQAGRGVAALAVLLFHLDYIGYENFGEHLFSGALIGLRAGVDFFFVLSGYIIMSAHYCDLGRPEQAPRYLFNRIVRIYPLLFIANATKVAYLLTQGTDAANNKLQIALVVRSFMVMTSIQNGLLDVSWTLTHELLFYVLFLVGIVVSMRIATIMAGVWIATILCMSFASPASLTSFDQVVFSPRNLQFLLGCGAYVFSACHPLRIRGAWLLFVIGLTAAGFGLATSSIAMGEGVMVRMYWGGAFGAVIMGIAAVEVLRGLHVPSWLVLLGDTSYSVYLFHTSVFLVMWKVFRWSGLLGSLPWISATLLLGAISLGVTVILGITIEKPLLKLCRRKFEAYWEASKNPSDASTAFAVSEPPAQA